MRSTILDASATAFIDSKKQSNDEYRPQLVLNSATQKVLNVLSNELQKCESFDICVAFITESGIAPLKGIFDELERKGVRGRVITTDYLTFSQPKALEDLNRFENIDLRMYQTHNGKGFHTKSYAFKKNGHYSFVIGSSNMTAQALCVNHEWNTRFASLETGAMAKTLCREFDLLWNDPCCQAYGHVKTQYESTYIANRKKYSREVEADLDNGLSVEQSLSPNVMQRGFIANLKKLYEGGANKALLISATGTGKTYASAFAMKEFKASKVLFIVHREQIARKAKESFQRVFGHSYAMGIFTGNEKSKNTPFLFATIQTLSKDENLNRFFPTDFDYIVIDEVHHAAASTYKKIMNFFKPKLWLGMTGSPDRPDDKNVYEIFDHHIAYEIRLQHALEEDLLCPFHYFGITDISINGKLLSDEGTEDSFSKLEIEQRAFHLIEKSKKYGYSGNRVKCLVFCRSIQEAEKLSAEFNRQGLNTTYLTGENTQEEREEAITRLVTDDPHVKQLDYIFTQDIFNEGVDIPEVNQIIMIRPTQSPIVFIQQLGRGLRKSKGKEFVVILDFIGNYKNNFLIPVALSGDNSYNKDNLRRYVATGTQVIPGISTVYFDEIARKEIYKAIDGASTQNKKFLKSKYQELKNKLGRIPTLKEFDEYGAVDVLKIVNAYGSYHAFLREVEKSYTVSFESQEEQIINFVSTKLSSGKRVHELVFLDEMLKSNTPILSLVKSRLLTKYSLNLGSNDYRSVVSILTNSFSKQTKFNSCVFVQEKAGDYLRSLLFNQLLKKSIFKDTLQEIIDFGIRRFETRYRNRYKDTHLVLYEKYTYEDVCHLLNWTTKVNAQIIGGYFYHQETKTFPVFINYHKSDTAIQYEDRFVSSSELIALSKHPRNENSSDADHIYKRTEADQENRIFLFVRKNKDDKETKEFYFLGEIEAYGQPEVVELEVSNDTAFEIHYRLDVPVRADIYDYLVGEQ